MAVGLEDEPDTRADWRTWVLVALCVLDSKKSLLDVQNWRAVSDSWCEALYLPKRVPIIRPVRNFLELQETCALNENRMTANNKM